MRTDIIRRTGDCCRDPVNPARCRDKCKRKKKINFLLWPLIYLHIVSITPKSEYWRAHNGPESAYYVYVYVCVCVYTLHKEGFNGALFSFFYFVTFLSVGRHSLRTGLAWDWKVRVGFCLLFYIIYVYIPTVYYIYVCTYLYTYRYNIIIRKCWLFAFPAANSIKKITYIPHPSHTHTCIV